MNREQKDASRTIRLIEYFNLLIDKKAGKAEFYAYEADLQSATPFEVNEALDAVLSIRSDVESLAPAVSQFIRAVGKALEAYPKPLYPKDHLLYSLEEENTELQDLAMRMQQLSLRIQQRAHTKKNKKEGSDHNSDKGMHTPDDDVTTLKALVASCDLLKSHYVRLQNELFPLFEKTEAHHSCVKLMWALQDRALALQKSVGDEHQTLSAFWKTFGQFYFHLQILLYRERHILFPAAYQSIKGEMVPKKGEKQGGDQHLFNSPQFASSMFVSPTGTLDFAVLERIFKVLPVDIAFIDSDDRVGFYSDPPHRIFVRSPEVIGRLVQNCHPPKSVATVEKILTSFKDGSEDSAEFYLSVRGRFVHIEYFALRDGEGSYLGTLEVTQDATHLRALVGEKRLL